MTKNSIRLQSFISSSSSSSRAASTDIPDPLSPLLPIIHRFWQVFWVISRHLHTVKWSLLTIQFIKSHLFAQSLNVKQLETIISRFQVQSWLQANNNTRILNTCTRLWITESELATLVVSIKNVVRSFVEVPEFDKHLTKAGGHIGRIVLEITIKIKTIVRKNLLINRIVVSDP